MENNKKVKYMIISVNAALILLIVIAAVFAYKTIFVDKADKKASSVSQITIKEDKYKSITSPQNYGTPISTSTEGFGRSNPFEPF